jgi:L-tartrate/succinate antiporter
MASAIAMKTHPAAAGGADRWWRVAVPLGVAACIALLPSPAGLEQHAWFYFAIFSAVIAALVVEPLPNAAVGLIGVTLVAVLSRWVLFSPEQLADGHFDVPGKALDWALTGFSSSTVWLVFSAFMFALGYEKTGLGRRIALVLVKSLGRNTLTLGYAAVITDTLLAPVTPSNTARSAGTIFPIIRNLPPLYDSLPHDESARKIGGYLMWTSFAACAVTSSLFMTACAPNLLAVEFISKILNVEITWQQWFMASAPFALPLLFALPVLVYLLYPPQIRQGAQVSTWATSELAKMGPLSRNEIVLSVLVLLAITLWIFGTRFVEAATAALIVIGLMLMLRVITWNDMARNSAAWTTLVLLATLVTLAGGLSKTGFIPWFAHSVAAHVTGLSPTAAVVALVTVYFFSHYMFASLTAHTSALMPVMLAVGMGIPGVPAQKLALALALTTGIMGVITPYATGPGLVYYESGYIPATHFWRLGSLFGLIFLAALLLIGVPLLMSA